MTIDFDYCKLKKRSENLIEDIRGHCCFGEWSRRACLRR
jgi:hypothetical protein